MVDNYTNYYSLVPTSFVLVTEGWQNYSGQFLETGCHYFLVIFKWCGQSLSPKSQHQTVKTIYQHLEGYDRSPTGSWKVTVLHFSFISNFIFKNISLQRKLIGELHNNKNCVTALCTFNSCFLCYYEHGHPLNLNWNDSGENKSVENKFCLC